MRRATCDVLAARIGANVTPIFSLERYDTVMGASLEGLEQARVEGHDLAAIASVASFFVLGVDTAIDALLDDCGRGDLRGQAATANARLAHAR